VGLDAPVVAVSVVELPAQMVVEFTLTTGRGFTVTVLVSVREHVVTPSVTVTE